MTLTFFEVEYRKKRRVLKTKLLLHNRKLYLTYGMVLFGDVDWPPNASRMFVSISWALSFLLTLWTVYTRQMYHKKRPACCTEWFSGVSACVTCAVDVLVTDDVRHAHEFVLRQPNLFVLFHGDRVFSPVEHQIIQRIGVCSPTHTFQHPTTREVRVNE